MECTHSLAGCGTEQGHFTLVRHENHSKPKLSPILNLFTLHTAIGTINMPADDQPATKDDIRAMLAEFSYDFDKKLGNTKAQVLELQSKATSQLIQKLKESKAVKWRREGNQRQFDFNRQV